MVHLGDMTQEGITMLILFHVCLFNIPQPHYARNHFATTKKNLGGRQMVASGWQMVAKWSQSSRQLSLTSRQSFCLQGGYSCCTKKPSYDQDDQQTFS